MVMQQPADPQQPPPADAPPADPPTFELDQLSEQVESWLATYGLDAPGARLILAGGAFVAILVVLYGIRGIILWRMAKWSEKTTTVWDGAAVAALRHAGFWFAVAVAAFCGSFFLVLPEPSERYRQIINTAMLLILLLQVAVSGTAFIGEAATRYGERRRHSDPAATMTINALAMLGKLLLFAVLLLLALDNLAVDVTALVAGLGVGGIAVALAVQNVLGDLLASLSIVFDKPFVPGDFIVIGDHMGTVEKIGLKTTRLSSLTGEQLIFANNDLLQSRIRNYKRMRERRIVFPVGVTYDTPRAMLEAIPGLLRESVETQENVRFDRAHFKDFGDFALNYETVYYVLSPDFAVYMDVQQAINLAIHQRFEERSIEFAFPTQTLHLQKAEVA
jgi:small-conductance mechanosensitive channel